MPLIKATSQNFTKSVLGSIEGDKIATIGVGSSEGLRPKSGVLRIDGLAFQNESNQYSRVGGNNSNALDGTITLSNLGFTSDQHNFSSGDRILYHMGEDVNIDNQNFMVGLVEGRHYYAIPVNATSFKLARTHADATASTPVPITFGSTHSGTTTLVPIHRFENLSKLPINTRYAKIQNSLFDYGTQNPNELTLNASPFLKASNENINYVDSNDIGTVPYWRRYSSLLTNGTFVPYAGTEWLTNESPYKRVQDTARQSKVLSLYGSSTLLPNNIGYASSGTGGYSGFYNINEKVQNGSGASGVAAHSKQGSTVSLTDTLAGNSDYWVKHEWYQQVPNTAKLVRPNGKIKFGVKVRQPLDDLMRVNDFAGMYVKLEYPSNRGQKSVVIGYFKIQRSGSTEIDLPTGNLLTNFFNNQLNERKINWHGADIYGDSTNKGDSQRGPSGYGAYKNMTIQELDTVYAEDIRDFEEIEVEMYIPSDIMPLIKDDYLRDSSLYILQNTTQLDYQDIALSVGLYYSDHCANLMGMEGAIGTAEDNAYSTVNVGERVFMNNSATGVAAQAMGYEYNGSVFTDFNSATIPRGSLLRKKSGYSFTSPTRDVVNDTQVRSNGLVVGDPYFIDSLDGITQAEMHELAGTVPGVEIPVEYMIPGETYTISDVGTSGSWSTISEQNEAFPQFIIGPSVDNVGYAFKFKGFSQAPPTGGKVTKGGYPKFTLFVPKKTTTDQKGYFTRTSGSVQFYSPFIDILPPSDLPPSSFVPYLGEAFGGTTIAENDQFSYPALSAGVFSWAGFVQSNYAVYPYRFYGDNGSGNGGQVSFTGAVDGGGSTTIRFKFNHMPYNHYGDDEASTETTETYSVVISGATEQTYTIDIPTRTQRVPIAPIAGNGVTTEAEKTNEFNELVMYIGTDASDNGPGTTITFKDLAITDHT